MWKISKEFLILVGIANVIPLGLAFFSVLTKISTCQTLKTVEIYKVQ